MIINKVIEQVKLNNRLGPSNAPRPEPTRFNQHSNSHGQGQSSQSRFSPDIKTVPNHKAKEPYNNVKVISHNRKIDNDEDDEDEDANPIQFKPNPSQ